MAATAPPTAPAPAPAAPGAPTSGSLYVGDLDKDVTEAQLFELFSTVRPCGDIGHLAAGVLTAARPARPGGPGGQHPRLPRRRHPSQPVLRLRQLLHPVGRRVPALACRAHRRPALCSLAGPPSDASLLPCALALLPRRCRAETAGAWCPPRHTGAAPIPRAPGLVAPRVLWPPGGP